MALPCSLGGVPGLLAIGVVPDQRIIGAFAMRGPIEDLGVSIGPDLEKIIGGPCPRAAVVIPTAKLSGFVGMAGDGKVVSTYLPVDEKAGQHFLNPDRGGRGVFRRQAEISVDGVSVVTRELMPDPQDVLTQFIQHIRHGIIREIEQSVLTGRTGRSRSPYACPNPEHSGIERGPVRGHA